MNTYWLDWYPENGKFYLRFAEQDNPLAEKAHKLLWPCILFEQVENSALMEAYQTNKPVTMDVSNQELKLKKDYKSLGNIKVEATPERDMYGNPYIHCVYTCLLEDTSK